MLFTASSSFYSVQVCFSVCSCDQFVREQLISNYVASGKAPPKYKTKATTIPEAIRKGGHYYTMLQSEDGHWANDFAGPHLLMPGLVVAWYIMGKPTAMLDEDQVSLMRHHIIVHQQTDGGWGTHNESPSTMFGTVLMYMSLRLLGVKSNDPVAIDGRKFLHKNGGALKTGSWAKFYLCLLGCMEWEGHNPVPPEVWLLPNWFPFHPCRMWNHSRLVYLPMGYLFGHRFVYRHAETDPTILSFRE